jgi:mannose-6-phosphate isomerase-like protein (cupin superfamily)
MFRSFIGLIISLTFTAAAAGQLKDAKYQLETSVVAAPDLIVRTATDASPLKYDAGSARFLLSRRDTGGRYSLVELAELPGYSTPLHIHKDMDEAFYVLDGTLTADIAGKRYELTAGSSVIIPRGTPHAQGNFGKIPVRLLVTTSPGGFEQFFLDRVELFKTMKPENPEFGKRMDAIIEKANIEVVGPWKP